MYREILLGIAGVASSRSCRCCCSSCLPSCWSASLGWIARGRSASPRCRSTTPPAAAATGRSAMTQRQTGDQTRRAARSRRRRHPRVRQRAAALVALRLLPHDRVRGRLPGELPPAAAAAGRPRRDGRRVPGGARRRPRGAAGAPPAAAPRTWRRSPTRPASRRERPSSRGRTTLCFSCHRADLGGLVGPNLTDDHWLHGCSIGEVVASIKTGYPPKGMLPFGVGKPLTDEQVLQVAELRAVEARLEPAEPEADRPRARQGVPVTATHR